MESAIFIWTNAARHSENFRVITRLDRFLAFVFNHQFAIIEIIFAVILAIAVVWLFVNLKEESSSDKTKGGQSLQDIESALKRVLESTVVKMPTAAQASSLIKDDDDREAKLPKGPPPTGTSAGADPAELLKLKTELETKAKKVSEVELALNQAREELKKAKETPGAAGAPSNTDDLQQKIKTLEARLGEYEIIEDDIANLSLYKEENSRLKTELEKIKKASGVALAEEVAKASPPAPEAAPVVEKKIDQDKLLQEVDAIASQSLPLASPPASPQGAVPSAAATDEKDSGEKLIAEFENFMKGSGG